MHSNTVLLSIVAYARSGALDYARRLFRDAGLDRIDDDPAVLSIRGRLLKDSALGTSGRKQQELYREAAAAYARAGEIGNGASYPLINAATLSFLAGDRGRAQTLARKILKRGQRGEEEGETPYWRTATLAEAHLLLGEVEQAKRRFKDAVALSPQAYEDHASTLRQFALILDALGKDRSWLDPYRPPRSLHFAGHMAVPQKSTTLESRIRHVIRKEQIGFGYGALAAGADILIAEALLEAGAELHVILPGSASAFRAASVVPVGNDWAKRFDAILERAASVREMPLDTDPHAAIAVTLAARVAMGSAVIQAESLKTEPLQLLILEQKGNGASGSMGETWAGSGRRQHVLTVPRVRARGAAHVHEKTDTDSNCLVAALRIDLSGVESKRLSRNILPKLARILGSSNSPSVPPRWTGEAVVAAFESPTAAAHAALSAASALAGVANAKIAGHYAIAQRGIDPFSNTAFVTGAAVTVPAQMILSTPESAIHVSENFAAALYAESTAAGRPHAEFVGELALNDREHAMRLFSLKP